MFSGFRRLVGVIKVEEKGDFVTVSGLPADFIGDAIHRIWATSKIGAYMFSRLSSSYLTFHRFFVPDVIYTLQTVAADKRSKANVRAINKVLEELYEHTWAKTILQEYPSILDYSKLKLFKKSPLPHQTEYFETFDRNVQSYQLKGYLLGARPGAGKTYMGLALAEMVDSDIVINIVPKNAVDRVWEASITTEGGEYVNPRPCWTSIGDKPLDMSYKYYVVHFDQLEVILEFAKKNQESLRNKRVFINLDESHNFNKEESLRTELFVELVKVVNPIYTHWMSGTPIKAVGVEVIPFLRCIDQFFNDKVADRFKKIFGKSATRANDILRNRMGFLVFKTDNTAVNNDVTLYDSRVKIPNGDEYTLEAIGKLMKDYISERVVYYRTNMPGFVKTYEDGVNAYRKTIKSTSDILELEKYERNAKLIRTSFDMKTQKEIIFSTNKFEKTKIIPILGSEQKVAFRDAKSVYKYFSLKVQGEALGRILGRQRTQCNVDMVKGMKSFTSKNRKTGETITQSLSEFIDGASKKTLIFTSFVEVVDAVADYVTELGYRPLKVYGLTNKDLPAIVAEYGANEDANPLIATFASLGTAVPITYANSTLMMNSPFRSYEFDQALARTDRIGQDSPVSCSILLLDTDNKPNISTRSEDIMNWSKEQVKQILGIETDESVAIESFKGLNDKDTLYKIAQEAFGGDVDDAVMALDVDELEDLIGGIDHVPEEVIAIATESIKPKFLNW